MKKNIFVIFLTLPFVLLAQSSITIGTGATLTVGASADVCAGSKTVLGTITGDGAWCTTLPLPVELTSFTAAPQTPLRGASQSVELKWETATEVNNYGFAVERSNVETRHASSLQWEKIGFVQGYGNSNSPKNYSFTDNLTNTLALDHDLNLDRLQYRLKQIDFDGKYEYSKVVEVKVETPKQFKLAQNYPNPFNPETVISYQIPVAGHVTLKVYDVLGREVATLVNEMKEAGSYNAIFSARHLERSREIPSGIYFYRLKSGSFSDTKKFLLMK